MARIKGQLQKTLTDIAKYEAKAGDPDHKEEQRAKDRKLQLLNDMQLNLTQQQEVWNAIISLNAQVADAEQQQVGVVHLARLRHEESALQVLQLTLRRLHGALAKIFVLEDQVKQSYDALQAHSNSCDEHNKRYNEQDKTYGEHDKSYQYFAAKVTTPGLSDADRKAAEQARADAERARDAAFSECQAAERARDAAATARDSAFRAHENAKHALAAAELARDENKKMMYLFYKLRQDPHMQAAAAPASCK